MPVLFDSGASASTLVDRFATSGSVSATLNVSPAATNVVAIAAILFTTEVDTSSSTFTVSFGGTPMVANGTASRWNANREYLQWFILDGSATGGATVPTGTRTVTASVASVPTEPNAARPLMLVVGTWANVDTVGTSVAATASTATTNSVTVPSVLPAHKVVSVLAMGNVFGSMSGYNQTLRASAQRPRIAQLFWYSSGGTLFLGDAPGATSVVTSATQPSSAFWGARGITLSPVPVVAGSALTVAAIPSASGGTYRTASPSSDRYWTIPKPGTDDPTRIAGDFVRGADDVMMPVWVKDPHDVEDYTLDWSNIIPEDDEIISVTFTPSSSALNVFSVNFGDSEVTGRESVVTSCWFTGGVANVNYGVVCHVTTAEGRQHDRTFRIVGGQK